MKMEKKKEKENFNTVGEISENLAILSFHGNLRLPMKKRVSSK